MDIDQEKRMAGDYEIIHALHIGDREIVLGENPSAPEDEDVYKRQPLLSHRRHPERGWH